MKSLNFASRVYSPSLAITISVDGWCFSPIFHIQPWRTATHNDEGRQNIILHYLKEATTKCYPLSCCLDNERWCFIIVSGWSIILHCFFLIWTMKGCSLLEKTIVFSWSPTRFPKLPKMNPRKREKKWSFQSLIIEKSC